MRQKRAKGFLKSYLQSISPPYTTRDILPIFLTILVLLGAYFGLKPVLANAMDSEPPTVPILLTAQNLSITPYTHSEQNTYHLFWSPSTDNVAVAGYRIFRNNVLIGETTQSQYHDYHKFGENYYTIESYDASGNVAKSANWRIFLPEIWCNCADQNDAVIAGFVYNSQTNKPLEEIALYINIGQPPRNLKIVNPTSNTQKTSGFYVNPFRNGENGTYQVSVSARGYQSVTKQIDLKAGFSAHQDWYLTPESPKGNRK